MRDEPPSPAAKTPRRLALDPPVLIYGPGDTAALLSRLSEVDNATLVLPVTRAPDLLMDEKGRTREGGYRFTTAALLQLCQLLSPGLGQLVSDLVGPDLTPEGWAAHASPHEYSRALAADTINRLITLRPGRVVGRQVVRGPKTIDGIVGPKYRYLSNLSFLRRVGEVRTSTPAVLHEASLAGRYFAARYVLPATRFAAGPDQFVGGLYYVNSEVGDSSVRTAPLLVRDRDGSASMGPFTGRISHAGKDFERRLARVTQAVEGKLVLPALSKRLHKLHATPLGLGASKVAADEQRRRAAVAAALYANGLSQSLAEAVLLRAMLRGSGDGAGGAAILDRQRVVLQSRTAYDIYCSLASAARSLHIDAREAAEQVAFALLSGKFQVT